MRGLSENENHFKIGPYLTLLWAKNRRKSHTNGRFGIKPHFSRSKIAGGNKNGWVGGISWWGVTSRYEYAKMESFEIEQTTKLDLHYEYLTVKTATRTSKTTNDTRWQRWEQDSKRYQRQQQPQHDPSGLGPSLLDPSADGPATQGTTEIHYRNRDADQHLPHALMSVLVV